MQWSWLNRHRNYRTLKVSEYIKRLELAGINNAEQETFWLMAHALGVPLSLVYAHSEFTVEEAEMIESVIMRREAGEPLQYILGEGDFWGRDFAVGKGVLIPRHDTETLIQAVMKYFALDEEFTFIDWGTGSGCIAITILLEFTNAYGYLVENNPYAEKYALKNINRYNLTHRAMITTAIPHNIHCKLIISNPPYIPTGEIAGLVKTVRDYEPHSALDGGFDGLMYYREIFAEAEKMECQYVFLETGNVNQLQSLKTMSTKFLCCDQLYDYGNFPRCLVFSRRY